MEFTKNQLLQVTIEDIGTDGEGIGKVDGFPLFIKDAIPGDVITARITKVKKTYAFARVEEILCQSEDRVCPRCSKARACGGCQIQALSYEKQLLFKENKVLNNLRRIGGFSEELLQKVAEPIIGMEDPWRYRNKAQYPIGRDKNGKIIAGFYAGRTHSIIEEQDCQIGAAENKPVLKVIIAWMEQNRISPYDENTGKGIVRHVLIRKARLTGQLMVCLIVNLKSKQELPAKSALIEGLSTIEGMHSISVNYNMENTNVIMGDETECIWGSSVIEDAISLWTVSERDYTFRKTNLAVQYEISPRSFYQVNPVQTEKLYSTAIHYAALTGKETVWDLYCGIGTISLFLATKAGKVFGVEIIPQAIEDAKRNAKKNALENATFFVGKAEEVLPAYYAKSHSSSDATDDMKHPDVIVVDPPRKGCDEACLSTMLQMQPSRIVYVSCDSATLARDLKILCAGGYELKKVRPCDMFPHTTHVESVVLITRKDK